MKTIIIYGSTTGNAKESAEVIAHSFKEADLMDVCDVNVSDIKDYELLILGTSTAGHGDLQDEWEDKIGALSELNLAGKTVAIFGTGDQESYPDSFAGSLNYLYNAAENGGAKLIGRTSTDGYIFNKSESARGNQFVGLVLDDENQANKTDQRVKDWVVQLVEEL
ncbi:MAG: flavodoxin [Spirochaetaceae bacterium]